MRILLVFLLLLLSLHAEESDSLFIDDEDGDFDVSKFLATRYGFLPIPVIVTGPTFGFGGGLNLMFLHGSLVGTKSSKGKVIPPSISGIAAVATENGSKGALAYHIGFYLDGDLRTTTFAGLPDANMDFYPLGDDGVTINLKGEMFYQEVKYRLGDSDWFAGANYMYLKVDTRPENSLPTIFTGTNLEGILTQTYTNTALAAVIEYDSRNTIFTSTEGTYFKTVIARYDEAFGGDSDYTDYRTKLFHYISVSDTFDIGLRFEGEHISGNAPFFANPSISLRGIAKSRYQGQSTVVAETQLNWEFINRWTLIGFLGTGKAFGSDAPGAEDSYSSASYETAGGVGFRYTIAKKFKIKAGLDFAKGPEEDAVYITIGSAWNAFF